MKPKLTLVKLLESCVGIMLEIGNDKIVKIDQHLVDTMMSFKLVENKSLIKIKVDYFKSTLTIDNVMFKVSEFIRNSIHNIVYLDDIKLELNLNNKQLFVKGVWDE